MAHGSGEALGTEQYPRRAVLRWAAGLAGLAATQSVAGDAVPNLLYTGEVDAVTAAADPFTHEAGAPRPLPRHDQLAVTDNPRFAKELGKGATHAYMVVHPGYMLSEAEDVAREYGALRRSEASDDTGEWARYYYWRFGESQARRDDREVLADVANYFRGRYGDYQKYLNGMAKLFEHLRHVDEPVIVLAEGRDVYHDTIRRPEFMPPENAFIVVTQTADPTPTSVVGYKENGKTRLVQQNVEALYSWLQRSGINTVHIAGEKGVHTDTPYLACVGGAALDLTLMRISRGGKPFDVHGMDGLIFPNQNNFSKDDRLLSDTVRAMYVDTVPPPAAS